MSDNAETPEVQASAALERANVGVGVILDVREPEELLQVEVPGAMHVPLGELNLRLADIPNDKEVYVLCHVGQRSAMATDFLRSLGHERVWNIQGGIVGWAKAGLPLKWHRGG